MTFYSSSGKYLSWLEIHRHLVQAMKYPKNVLFLHLSSLVLLLNISQLFIYTITFLHYAITRDIIEYIITLLSL